MPRTITYEILDKPDGRFCVVAAMAPDRIYRRDDLATLAEAEAWIEGLRVLMAACGAPAVRARECGEREAAPPVASPQCRVDEDGERLPLGTAPQRGFRGPA